MERIEEGEEGNNTIKKEKKGMAKKLRMKKVQDHSSVLKHIIRGKYREKNKMGSVRSRPETVHTEMNPDSVMECLN